MRLINYKYGYNDTFNCSIHGKIILTQTELDHFLKYHGKKLFDVKDLSRRIETKKGYYINIRVDATEALVKFYKLEKYRRGNYALFINNL